jgi:hypothetical protein
MPKRGLTCGELTLLQNVYGLNTLPLINQQISTNDGNWGGAGNSITPRGTPYYSNQIFVSDFSAVNVASTSRDSNSLLNSDKVWTFVHEFGHVWQFLYGPPPWVAFLLNPQYWANYPAAYPYNLNTSPSLFNFNIEQAASIIADYWALSNGVTVTLGVQPTSNSSGSFTLDSSGMAVGSTAYNANPNAQVSDYSGYISQVQNPNPPSPPPGPSGNGIEGTGDSGSGQTS